MADISMCMNQDCPSKMDCYRFTAPANPYRQAYMDFKPDQTGKCDDFVPTKETVVLNGTSSSDKRLLAKS